LPSAISVFFYKLQNSPLIVENNLTALHGTFRLGRTSSQYREVFANRGNCPMATAKKFNLTDVIV
jgi:hypothetical protein